MKQVWTARQKSCLSGEDQLLKFVNIESLVIHVLYTLPISHTAFKLGKAFFPRKVYLH